MTKEKMAPKRRKKIFKSRNKALHIEKKAPIRGENPHGFFLQGGGEGLLSPPPPPPPPLLAHMIKSDYKMRNIFENYLSHNYVKIHSRLHLIELFLKNFKIFSEEHTLKSPSSKKYLSIISNIIPPYLNMDFFIKNHSFMHVPTPSPLSHKNRVCP